MSEKRFVKFYLDTEIVPYSIVDAENGDAYPIDDEGIFETVVDLLNKQQDTIGEQKIAIDELITDYKKLEKENEQLRLKVFLMSEKRYVEIDGKICLVEELSQEDILNHLNDLLGEK